MLRFGQFVRGFNPAQRDMPPEENDDVKLELLEVGLLTGDILIL